MEILKDIDVNDLIKHEPSKILEWISNIKEDKIPLPQDFNWLGLANVATGRAQRLDDDINLSWARVAIEVYDFLMRTDCQESYYTSIMNVRVYFIKRLGTIKNDPILDLDEIVQWFFQSLSISLDEVRKIVDNWNKLDIRQLRELRRIKNRLSKFKYLDTDLLKIYPELLDWLTIHHKLP